MGISILEIVVFLYCPRYDNKRSSRSLKRDLATLAWELPRKINERGIEMKREFLKELGLDDEVVDKVMAVYGKGIEKVKGEQADTEELNKRLSDLEEKNRLLTEENTQYKTTVQANQSTVDELTEELNTTKLSNLKPRITLENGLPYNIAGRLVGEDEETLLNDAKKMAELIQPQQLTAPLKSMERDTDEVDPYAALVQGLNLEGE